MINAPTQLEWLNKLTDWLSITPNKWSLFRIILWTLLFLTTAHFLVPKVKPQLPYADEMEGDFTPIASSTSDPRYVRNDLKTLPENSILWVAGSSITIKQYEDDLLTYLPASFDIDNPQYVSLKIAQRSLDTYTLIDDAISRQPAMLVIVLNPFWILNDNSLFFKKNVMNAGASQWKNSLVPLLASPANMLWGVAGRHHNLTANGHDYLKLAKKSQTKDKKPKAHKQVTKKISYNQPLLFWSTQRYADGKDFSNFGAKEWQIEAMNQNNLTQSVWSEKLLRQTLDKIKDSNIPTLIYVAPVSPTLERTPAREAYRTVIHQLRAIMAPYKSDKISIITDFNPELVKTLDYIDYMHLRDSGDLPDRINLEIQALQEKK